MNPKRKRGGEKKSSEGSPTDLDRLVRFVTKTLRRVGKVAKAHETQKVVKRLKQQNAQHAELLLVMHSDDSSNNSAAERTIRKSSKKIDSLERKLLHMKQFEMDVLLKLCMKRLGLKLLGVDLDRAVAEAHRQQLPRSSTICTSSNDNACCGIASTTNQDSKDATTSRKNSDNINEELVETLLLHKNLSVAMDMLNKRITEYRKELLRAAGEDIPPERIMYRRDKKKLQQQSSSQQWSNKKRQHHEGPGSMFLDSLSGEVDNSYSSSRYGPADVEPYHYEMKKNRPGQRARQAKAMIQQAKKEGKSWNASINWRPKKATIKTEEEVTQEKEPSLHKKKKIEAAEVADMGKDWKAEGKAHPSWAAKQHVQKSSIAPFMGKKITF